ncbi:aromatic motif membrane protein [Mycoplasmopsis iners]|uniref:aromatic motif membrane protein n=1 Tax=Mycoplasmopsis iners TaxID=76630 RepID=UPI000497A51D|nr:aromatic motif membrane protein [Mycoplasmopsis iners]
MKNKILSLLTLTTFGSLTTTLSCANYVSISNFEKNIDHELDFNENKQSNEQLKTLAILNTLLDVVYKNDNAAKILFLNQQNNEQIKNKFIELSNRYSSTFSEKDAIDQELIQLNKDLENYNFLPSVYSQQIKNTKAKIVEAKSKLTNLNERFQQYLSDFGQLASENWYWFLTNIDKFKFDYFQYIASDLINRIKSQNNGEIPENFKKYLTDEYLQKIENAPLTATYKLSDNHLNSIALGDESKDSEGTYYYLNTGKLVMRIQIENGNTNSMVKELSLQPYIWYFASLKTPEISLKLISSIYHYAFIHAYLEGYGQFTNDMVVKQRYGEPVYVLPIIAGETNEN